MIQIRSADQRGGGDHGWLKTHHTFSFADYWDPKWMGFRSLRVINEDWVAPNTRIPDASASRHGNHHLCSRGQA